MQRKILYIVLGIIAALFVATAIFRPEWLSQAWLWLVGFAGFIYGGIRKIGDFFGSEKQLKDIEDSNQEIKENYARIQRELQEAREQLQLERQAQQKEIERLETQLQKQKSDYQALQEELRHLQTVSYQDYYESLSPHEKQKLEDDIWSEVDFGL